MLDDPKDSQPDHSDDQQDRNGHTAQYRGRATVCVDEIARRTKVALTERGILLDVFFVVPNSGEAIISFGTTVEPDPSDQEWEIVSDMICDIVSDVVGVDRLRTRNMACAAALHG